MTDVSIFLCNSEISDKCRKKKFCSKKTEENIFLLRRQKCFRYVVICSTYRDYTFSNSPVFRSLRETYLET